MSSNVLVRFSFMTTDRMVCLTAKNLVRLEDVSQAQIALPECAGSSSLTVDGSVASVVVVVMKIVGVVIL